MTTTQTPTPSTQRGTAIPPGVEYHRVLAGEKRRVGRGILAIALLVGGMFLFSALLTVGFALIDAQFGNITPPLGGTDYTPLYHASAFGSVALVIPWSMLIQRWLYGVRGASLHSVVSRFRFDRFGRALLVIGPIIVAVLVFNDYLAPTEKAPMVHATALWLIATTLVLVPLQAAGEEYGLRGLVFRVAGSWGRGPRTSLVLGVLVSSVVFAIIHLSTDPWLNLWYLVFSVTTAIITWRTGGLELAVLMHALFNTLGTVFDVAVRTSLETSANREAGAAGPYMLAAMLVWIGVAAVVWIRTRRTGPALTPAA